MKNLIMRFHRKIPHFLTFILLCVPLSACTKVTAVEYAQSQDHPEDAYPAPIKFSSLKTQLPVGSEIGIHRPRCFLSFKDVGRYYLKGKINQSDINDAFAETLSAQDYDVVTRLNTVFDEEYEDEFLRSEYKIGAKIIDAQVNMCEQQDWVLFFPLKVLNPLYVGNGGFKGKLFLKIQWAVFDNLRRKVVYKTVTEGYVHRKKINLDGMPLMVNEAFSMAAHNLAAEKKFHDLIFYGTKPPDDWRKKKKHESRPRIYDPQESVSVKKRALSKKPFVEHIEKSRQVAVMVQVDSSHGSGYFITRQGHIITNAHVVGNAMRVRIVTAGKKEKLIAEVLRKDDRRDVALLKLEEVPEDLDIITVPLKIQWPQVSEEIYALGAPKNKKLIDTLSKGIVSAHRKAFKVFGSKLDFIQGDVSIHGGNSGGPLLDQYGNIVGMSVAGYHFDDQKTNASLNLFIPIEDALRRLHIEME